MAHVLKYYKLLFTLPSEKKSYALWIITSALAASPALLLAQLWNLGWAYQRRGANLRRLAVLYSIMNVLWFVNLKVLAVVLMVIASTLYVPWAPFAIIASAPALFVTPLALPASLPVLAVATRHKKRGVTQFGIYWLRAWMGDDYYAMEKFLKLGAVKEKATFVKRGATLFTDVHFGLMRFSMGSLMPYLIALMGHVPHRLCGSHERNPVSRWEVYKLLKEVRGKGEGELKISEAENEIVRVTKYNDVMIVSHKHGADDLPCVLPYLADPHNFEGLSPKPEELRERLKGLEFKQKASCEELEVCKVEVEGEDLCDNRGFLVRCNGFEHLVVFCNNLKEGNRDELPYDLVSTVDDHTCSGVGRVSHKPGRVESVKVLRCKRVRSENWELTVEYLAMGKQILSKEVQGEIVGAVREGLLAVALSLAAGALLSLI